MRSIFPVAAILFSVQRGIRRLSTGLLFAVSLVAPSSYVSAQESPSADEAARKMAAAIQEHDPDAMAACLSDSSREKLLSLLASSDELERARKTFDDAAQKAFPGKFESVVENPIRQSIRQIQRAEITGRREVDSSKVEFEVRLYRTKGTEVVSIPTKWVAENRQGDWKIELPDARDEAQQLAEKKRLDALASATREIAEQMANGKFPTAATAMSALIRAERATIAQFSRKRSGE